MKQILPRVWDKIRLWSVFPKIVKNWPKIWLLRVFTILKIPQGQKSKIIKLRNGALITYGPKVVISAVPLIVEIWLDKIYTPQGLSIGPTDIVVDIGANVGNFALFAARQTNGKVYAFEPVPKNFQLLQTNINLNSATNIAPLEMAVADKDATIEMTVSNVETAHSLYLKNFKSENTIPVKTIALESFMAQYQIPRIDFLKIDSEGAEYDTILNLPKETLAKIKRIVLEQHDRYTGRDHKQIAKFLSENGFRVCDYEQIYMAADRN